MVFQDKSLQKRSPKFQTERGTGPRFASQGSFEFEYGQKWKALHEMRKQRLEALDREMKLEEEKLMAQMEYARYEHETESLREQLRMREANRDLAKKHWEEREAAMGEQMRAEAERRSEEEKRMARGMQEREEGLRQRHQENSLFLQAQELNSMLDQQEADMGGMGGMGMGMGGGGGNGGPFSGSPGPFGGGGGGGRGRGDFGRFGGGGGGRGNFGGGGPEFGAKRKRF